MSKLRATTRPILRVEWVDSCSESAGWTRYSDLEDDHKFGPSRAVTVGFVIQENDEAITLSPNGVIHDGDDDGHNDAFDYTMTIPKVCVVSKTKLA